MLLQVLEDGHLSDAKGREVDFKNTIVIMTSNVGAELLGNRGDFGFTQGTRPLRHADAPSASACAPAGAEVRELFRPEFLNRVDDVIYFSALGGAEVRAILDLMLAQTQARLSEQLVDLRVTEAAKATWLTPATIASSARARCAARCSASSRSPRRGTAASPRQAGRVCHHRLADRGGLIFTTASAVFVGRTMHRGSMVPTSRSALALEQICERLNRRVAAGLAPS